MRSPWGKLSVLDCTFRFSLSPPPEKVATSSKAIHPIPAPVDDATPEIVDSSAEPSDVVGHRMLPLASMDWNPSVFGLGVRILRVSKQLDLCSAAETAGVSEGDWRRIEYGEAPEDPLATQRVREALQ